MGINIYEELEKIYYVDAFEKELKELKKQDASYGKWLNRQLEILNRGAISATNGKQFESLSNCDFYSIRRVSKINQRVIYFIIDDDESVILLTAFCEQRKSDYTNAIARAKKRLKDLKKELSL